jgi:RNase P subunit RPR2
MHVVHYAQNVFSTFTWRVYDEMERTFCAQCTRTLFKPALWLNKSKKQGIFRLIKPKPLHVNALL